MWRMMVVLMVLIIFFMVPAHGMIIEGKIGGSYNKKFPAMGDSSTTVPSSVTQLAHPGQDGYIDWNNELEPGDTVYILPTNTQRDKNGYVPLKEFQNATIAIYLYERSETSSYDGLISLLSKTTTFHAFMPSGKRYDTDIRQAVTTIPKQSVVFYDLPKHEITCSDDFVRKADKK